MTDLFHLAMEAYPYVVHPTTVLGVGTILLIYYEWNRQPDDRSGLPKRVGLFLATGVLAVLPTVVFLTASGQGLLETTKGNVWQVDWLVGGGVLVSTGLTWFFWRRFHWGPLVPDAMEVFALAMLPYLALSPFWNVSGHVLITLLPALYLTLVDRKFWPLNVFPLVMLPNRIYLGAHTWAEVFGGLLIGGLLTVLVYQYQTRDREQLTPAPAPD